VVRHFFFDLEGSENMTKILCVIPARMNSTRLPRKMLTELRGMPIIQHTFTRARQCKALAHCIVATDHEDIAAVVKNIGGDVVITSPECRTGSDRVAEVARQFSDVDVVINLQGDEPFIRPEMLTELLTPYYEDKQPDMATLGFSLKFPEEYADPANVKVLVDRTGYALYFSRSPIPFLRDPVDLSTLPVLHHMGLYAYKREFLLKFSEWEKTPLEMAESLEQLRALEHGHRIYVTQSEHRTLEINTPEELARAKLRAEWDF
jgi:3-deoxy-manno-octulosonate cytidylyltransferase (CMP-KDO synthetase)